MVVELDPESYQEAWVRGEREASLCAFEADELWSWCSEQATEACVQDESVITEPPMPDTTSRCPSSDHAQSSVG